MKISTSLLFAFLLIAASKSFCQNKSLISYKNYFENDLKSWAHSFMNLKLSAFKLTDTIKFENTPYGDIRHLKSFYKLYKPGLSFSADSTKFIDIYSYWLGLEKKGNKIVENAEVDQAISLCDLKKKKWMQIFFCGFSTRIDEAIWMTETKFILAGSFREGDDSFHARVLIGDITKQILYDYTNTLTTSAKTGYTPIKLKRLNIQEE